MEIVWVVLSTALLSFCLFLLAYRAGYRQGCKAGYKTGASRVLNEWKNTLNNLEEK